MGPLFLWAATIHSDPAQAASYFGQGIKFEKARQYQQAEQEFVMALAEDFGLVKTYRELGNCSYAQASPGSEYRSYKHAIGYYDKYLKAYPQDSAIRSFRTQLSNRQDQTLRGLSSAGEAKSIVWTIETFYWSARTNELFSGGLPAVGFQSYAIAISARLFRLLRLRTPSTPVREKVPS